MGSAGPSPRIREDADVRLKRALRDGVPGLDTPIRRGNRHASGRAQLEVEAPAGEVVDTADLLADR